MTNLLIHLDTNIFSRNAHIADGPMDFETWLRLAQDLDTELIDGVMVDRRAVEYPHEKLYAWLITMLYSYARKRCLGVVLGSRTAVKISDYDGRLPDILFVRAQNTGIIHTEAIYGVLDLVIEIVSPHDHPFELIGLEADYRTLGVPEIVFIDLPGKRVRLVRKSEAGYEESVLTSGRLDLRAVTGFWIEVDWLFAEVAPDGFNTVLQLLQEAERNTA